MLKKIYFVKIKFFSMLSKVSLTSPPPSLSLSLSLVEFNPTGPSLIFHFFCFFLIFTWKWQRPGAFMDSITVCRIQGFYLTSLCERKDKHSDLNNLMFKRRIFLSLRVRVEIQQTHGHFSTCIPWNIIGRGWRGGGECVEFLHIGASN